MHSNVLTPSEPRVAHTARTVVRGRRGAGGRENSRVPRLLTTNAAQKAPRMGADGVDGRIAERSAAAIKALLLKGKALREKMSHAVGEEWDDLRDGAVDGDAAVLPPTTWGAGAFTPAALVTPLGDLPISIDALVAQAAPPSADANAALTMTMASAEDIDGNLDALVADILAHPGDGDADGPERTEERGAVSLAGIGAKFETLGKVLHRVYAIRIAIRGIGAHAHRPGAAGARAKTAAGNGNRLSGRGGKATAARYVADRWEVSYALAVPPAPEEEGVAVRRRAAGSAFGFAGPGRSAVFSVAASRRREASTARKGWQMFAHEVEVPLLIDEEAAVRWINGDGKLVVRLACDGTAVAEATASLAQLLVSSDLAFRAKCPVIVREQNVEKENYVAGRRGAKASSPSAAAQSKSNGQKPVTPCDVDLSCELLLRPRDRKVSSEGRRERAASRPWLQPRYRAQSILAQQQEQQEEEGEGARGEESPHPSPLFANVAARPSARRRASPPRADSALKAARRTPPSAAPSAIMESRDGQVCFYLPLHFK